MKTGRFAWMLVYGFGLGVGLGAATAGCGVDEPPCSFACGPSSACPDDYQCLADGYCHLHGQKNTCGFSDLAPIADLTAVVPTDGGTDLPLAVDGGDLQDLASDL